MEKPSIPQEGDNQEILLQAELLQRHPEIDLANWIPEHGGEVREYIDTHPGATVEDLDKQFFNNDTLH